MDVTLRWPKRTRSAVGIASMLALLVTVLPVNPGTPTAMAAGSGCDRSAVVSALLDYGAQVRTAAEQALLGDDAQICAFLATGWEAARVDDMRTNINLLIATSGPSVRSAAEKALADDDPDQMEAFLETGYETPSDIDLRVRVNQIMAVAGPRLKVAAQTALDADTPEKLEEFIDTGWKISAGIDQRVQVNQVLAAGGSEVKRIAQRALDADDSGDAQALERFLNSEWEIASARDQETATIGDLATAARAAGQVAAQRTQVAVEQANQALAAAIAAAESAKKAEEAASSAGSNSKEAAAAAKLATTAARQAASAARQAIKAAQAARSSAQAAADAAARASTAAAKAGEEAAAANLSASLAAGDASKAEDARKDAKAAQKASANEEALSAAADYARTSGDLAETAAKYANSAAGHANDAAGSADRAGDYAQAAGASASDAHAAANDARTQANRAITASQEATAMASVARDAADTAQEASTAASKDAREAATAANDAADHAGDAATAADRSTKAANAATAAAKRSVASMAAAQKVYDRSRAADNKRLTLMLAQGQEAAVRSTQVTELMAAQADWDAAEANRRSADTNRLIAEAADPGTENIQAVHDARTAALTLVQSGGEWTQEAARRALSGTPDQALEFARSGVIFAAAQDDRATVTALTLGDANPKLAAAASIALAGSDADVTAFLKTQNYPGRETEERLAVNQVLAQARADANPVTQQRAQAALDSADTTALRNFIEVGQYAAVEVDERVKLNQLLADPDSTPEVKVAAQIALDAPGAAVHNFLAMGRFTAAQHDNDTERHEAAVSAMLSQGYMVSTLATKNAALAQKAAAMARNAASEAAQAAKDADAAANKAAEYAASAQKSADKANAAADRADASARKADAAAKSATSAADDAAKSANRADSSALNARYDAQDAYAAYQQAYDSAVAAGKDSAAAATAANTAIEAVNERIHEAQGIRANLAYQETSVACDDFAQIFDPEDCRDRIYEKYTNPGGAAYKNQLICKDIFDVRGEQYQNCLGNVQSPTFLMDSLLDSVTPYVFELNFVLKGAVVSVAAMGIIVPLSPAIFTACARFCGVALEAAAPLLSPELIGFDLAIGGGVVGAGAAGGAISYGLIRISAKLERLGVTSFTNSASVSRYLNIISKCTGANSFPPSTPVVLADGAARPIADIRVGDQVLSTDPETGATGAEMVTRLHTHTSDESLVEISVQGNSSHQGGTIAATENHPFWVQSQTTWKPAGQLRVGNTLRTGPGSWISINGITRHIKKTAVHNLTVTGKHTFYVLAGDTQILVHNTNCPKPEPIPYNSTDLSRKAFAYRKDLGITPARNVAVAKFVPDLDHPEIFTPIYGVSYKKTVNGRTISVHSEEHIKQQLKKSEYGNVTELYTERLPCSKRCDPMLKKDFPNAKVSYTWWYDESWPWQERADIAEQLRRVFNQFNH